MQSNFATGNYSDEFMLHNFELTMHIDLFTIDFVKLLYNLQ